ncbi:MAG: ATP-dependent zinc metalloprotease FtsH [Lachnospiraceae bacterium]|nr:ATP-dependent zinc metalloprotease FtsH [Lachnospiraceae bacterium]
MKKNRGLGIYILLVIVVALLWYISTARKASSISYEAFQKAAEAGSIKTVRIIQNSQVPTGSVNFTLKSDGNDVANVLYVSDVNKIEKVLQSNKISYVLEDVPKDAWMQSLLPMIIVIAVVFILFMVILKGQNMAMMQNGQNASNNKMMNFGKSRATMTTQDNIPVRFGDVAGLKEEKEELREVVEFLKDPGKFTKIGARIPKGLLLVGPPGTGKTLLARAVAGEAGVPFFSISGSDFVEMFVGVGASRVRDLFQEAKKNAPCIVFIDEIDAVARRRGAGLGGSHDEREQTLNQMLVEMDGFGANEGIIVLAATNRVDILDPAIMRPGRFDRKVSVGRPDIAERKEILGVHTRNKPLGEDVDLEQLARTTAGFTGADLENLLNEAAIAAAKDDREFITNNDIKNAFIKTGIGSEKKSRVLTEKERKNTAYHESGHALLYHLLPDVGPVYSVSIIPTGVSALGYTMPLPERDEMTLTRNEILENVEVALGGRIAEELVFEDITTGASNDIQKATKYVRDMVTKYGMSKKVGPICYSNEDTEVFLGKDLAHARSFGEDMATEIDREVKSIMEECYNNAKKIIMENMGVLHASANLLMDKEKITRDEFESLFEATEPQA